MKKNATLLAFLFLFTAVWSQPPPRWNSGDILIGLQKLRVLGTVLYVAAHPDDENTRLLGWLSKEKLYRTGYLSVTRGDGGQNLIGDEQGIELGLVRTQELLAARRNDGAEQFFTRAYDFGFSKNTNEALSIWDKEKILGDMVWVIRKFRPDVIITRFPPDSRAGHGQHSASAVLAREAFDAAANPSRYPEQLRDGVTTWKARRLFWNTFNFGNTNTIREDQFKVDMGGFNPLLGESYGEIAAESRNQHKSQGFGFYSSRGTGYEFFQLNAGDSVKMALLEGVNTTWNRVPGGKTIGSQIDQILAQYNPLHPEKSVPALVSLYRAISQLKEEYWREKKLGEVQQLIQACSGLYLEASTPQEFAVQGDSLHINLSVNNRAGVKARLDGIAIAGKEMRLDRDLPANRNIDFTQSLFVPADKPLSQPYWLEQPMLKGSYEVRDPKMIGKPWSPPAYEVVFLIQIEGRSFGYSVPVRYKFRDPVKGEVYEPLPVVPPVNAEIPEALKIWVKQKSAERKNEIRYVANRDLDALRIYEDDRMLVDVNVPIRKGQTKMISESLPGASGVSSEKQDEEIPYKLYLKPHDVPLRILRKIHYDHIPSVYYFKDAVIRNVWLDLKIDGSKIGYIRGAGDKIPDALEQMGYQVSYLEEKDMNLATLQSFDAIITGVRAFNVHDWMAGVNQLLMDYVAGGGNLVVQYNTNNFAGQLKAKIGPFPFVITGERVTDEESPVNILDPGNLVFNWPNKITVKDFEGWIQERGVYFAGNLSPEYKPLLGLTDPGEKELKGSLIVAQHGKGRFVYTGLSFFRQLPAGVPGAYRLFANIISNPVHAQ